MCVCVLTLSQPAEVKALCGREVVGDEAILHRLIEHTADLLSIVVKLSAHVQLHKHITANLPVGDSTQTQRASNTRLSQTYTDKVLERIYMHTHTDIYLEKRTHTYMP